MANRIKLNNKQRAISEETALFDLYYFCFRADYSSAELPRVRPRPAGRASTNLSHGMVEPS